MPSLGVSGRVLGGPSCGVWLVLKYVLVEGRDLKILGFDLVWVLESDLGVGLAGLEVP